ncbi:hypothetical protein G6F22_020173 [Rhizopus arrhizus]|nr:hypothetical protein G6F22_020173 [Rhizopus arrhizus]KAG0971869.1 hypothetical protein G6F28_014175 [Rhizopus arrhizus]
MVSRRARSASALASACGNGHRLVTVGSLVLGTDVDDTIGINIEFDLNLRNTLRGRRNTSQVEVTQKLVVTAKFTFTLEDTDGNLSLTIGGSRENLSLLGRDSGVTVDQTSKDTTEGFDTQGKRGNIEQ